MSLSLSGSEYTWSDYGVYNENFCQAMQSGRCYWPRGKMLGGTGSLNGNVFMPGQPSDYDEWSSLGNKGWSWKEISRHYNYALNSSLGANGLPRGYLVLNHFERTNYYSELVNLMSVASGNLRASHRCAQITEFNPFVLGTVERGIRMSTGKTYLGKVAPYRKNLKVIKQALVTEILIGDNHRAQGVKFLLENSKLMSVQIRREVIVSAGAFGSPKVLMLSGIGHSHHLQSVNIKPRYNLPVGDGLQDHGLLTLALKFTKNLPNIPSNDDFTSEQNIFDYFMHQSGPLSANPTLIGLIDTNYRNCYKTFLQKANIMIVAQIVQPTRKSNVFKFLKMREEIVEMFMSQVENQPMLELHGLLVKPRSRGYVRLNSSNPQDGPLIYNNYITDTQDARDFLSYIRYVQKLTRTPQFQHYGLELVHVPLLDCINYVFDSDNYWLCYMRYFILSAWHAASTVRMGPISDTTSVVNSELKVHGIQGLRVADASIMPNITSYNTNTPAVIIGEKAADLIISEQKFWHGSTN